jgi:nucleoside-diphosphate-sugar epimerase
MHLVIFGGSGFIGKPLTEQLLAKGYTVTVICQDRKRAVEAIGRHPQLQISCMDIFNQRQLSTVIQRADVVINAIGKLYEESPGDFQRYHVDFVALLLKVLSPMQRLIHLSALGIEQAQASSQYAKTKVAAEMLIREQAKRYHIIQPSVVFGKEDNFFNQFNNLARYLPALPLIGGGHTLFCPVYVYDVVEAIIVLIEQVPTNATYAACGPETASFKKILHYILNITARKRFLIPLPFAVARIQAYLMNGVGIYLLTPDQVALLQYDNTNQAQHPNIDMLIPMMHPYKAIVPSYIKK